MNSLNFRNKITILCCIFSIILKSQTPPQYQTVKEAVQRSETDVKKIFPFDIILRDTSGHLYSSEKVLPTKGKPLVLLFWLTTCGPCRHELAVINENYAAWKKEKDFRFIAISMDWKENFTQFTERVRISEWQFEALNDIQHEFLYVMPGGLNGLPQVFVLNDKGNITYQHRRFILGDEVELFEAIKNSK